MNTRNDNLLSRACRAWEQYQESAGIVPTYPCGHSSVVTHDGVPYAVLVDVSGVLAVYRELDDGSLRRLKEFPDALMPLVGMAA